MESRYGGAVLRIVRSDGTELTAYGCWRGGWAIAHDGLRDFLSLPITISTSPNVLTDGSTVVSKRVDECERTASIVYAGGRDPASVRDECLSFFNPKYGFECHVTYMGRTRWCEGELSMVGCEIAEEGRPLECSFSLICVDPYMRGEDGNANSLTDASPMFGFPYVSHARAPLRSGEKKPVGSLASKMLYDGLNTVYNSGDVTTYYTIRMEAMGDIQSPTFAKDDRFIQVIDRFVRGDVLEIDFTKAPPTVTKNGVNIIGKCSRDSNFTGMAMQVGPNVFQYSCSNSQNRPLMDVRILFYRKYLGV